MFSDQPERRMDAVGQGRGTTERVQTQRTRDLKHKHKTHVLSTYGQEKKQQNITKSNR